MRVLVLVSVLPAASAHEALEEPIPRYESNGVDDANKSCPCGLGPNDLMCSVASARSDPNRSTDRINVYEAGQPLTVRLREVVGHAGRWRIAFDPEGADLADFNANVLLDVADPPGNDGNVGQGNVWEFEITLPATPCDACTLQVIQVMNGDTVNPVPDPVGESSYYQCADLELTGGPPDTGTPGGTADTGPTGSTPTDTDPTTPSDTAPQPTTPTGGGAPPEGGCGCGPSPAPLGAPVLLALTLAVRRRTAAKRPVG